MLSTTTSLTARLPQILLAAMVIGSCLTMSVPASASGRLLSFVDEEPLRYRLSFDNAANHYVDVEMTIATGDAESIELMMATWTPGSYLIREYARNIDAVFAADDAGVSREVSKTTKNRWMVESSGASEITVTYRVYCRELSVRTNFVDADFAVLNGAPTFLTVVDRADGEHEVTVELPQGWQRAVTALDPDSGDSTTFRARDFHHLVDSPILIGSPSVYPFVVNDRQHLLVNIGDESMWNGAKAALDVAKLVEEHQRMWGTVPYRSYMFLNVIAEAGGGLEHDESTLMLTSRWSFRSPSQYQRWLGLVSHEFFHAWNVRTLRPSALADYDYESENYTPSLWIAEGVTSYYDDLALVRSGFVSKNAYLRTMSRQITSVESTPGARVQSLRDSSHDSWIKYYRQDENSRNTQISYYTKGAVVSFLLDMKIRELTDNESSLDDALRLLYERHHGGDGFTEDEFRSIMSEVAGHDLTEWFDRHVDSTQELDLRPAYEFLGMQIPPEVKEVAPDAQDSDASSEDGQPWLGFSGSDDNGKWIVSRIEVDSPAYDAGLNVDDEIVGVGDFRVSSSSFDRVLDTYELGDTIDLLITRRGKLRRLAFTLRASEPTIDWSMRVDPEATDVQKERVDSWLMIDDQDEDDQDDGE